MRYLLSVLMVALLAGCGTISPPTIATTTPTLTNAQVATKVANCVVSACAVPPAGEPLQTCLALAALQCATGY